MVFLINGIPVLVIECKNATKDEAIALGVDQIRRYHAETPEVMVPQMLFTATEAIGFSYGVTWNTGAPQHLQLEARGDRATWRPRSRASAPCRTCSRFSRTSSSSPRRTRSCRSSSCASTRRRRWSAWWTRAPLDPKRSRGLVWHTQGSGKTYTMIKAAELLFKAPEADKPTILLMIDRNELEDQMLKNLAALGLGNVAHADSIARAEPAARRTTTAASSSR